MASRVRVLGEYEDFSSPGYAAARLEYRAHLLHGSGLAFVFSLRVQNQQEHILNPCNSKRFPNGLLWEALLYHICTQPSRADRLYKKGRCL